MYPTVAFAKHAALLFMISLPVSVGCATSLKQQPTTVEPTCNITWDQTNDPKVSGYQLTVIDQSDPKNKAVRFIPAHTTKISCNDAGANHEGLWGVTVQSCYDTSTCGPPTEVVSMQVTAK